MSEVAGAPLSRAGVAVRTRALETIDHEQNDILEILRSVVRIRSENPPGNTVDVAAFVTDYLARYGIDYRVIDPKPEWPNVIATLRGREPGRRLALNDHMDHFPAGDPALWTHPPYAAEVVDGKIYGRGVSDNKNGIAGMLYELKLLRELSDHWRGEIVASFVSDEETFGPYGARYLVEHHPEVLCNAVLSAEQSGGQTIRFGEKGLIWLTLHVKGPGGHAAFTYNLPSAVHTAARIIAEVEDTIHLSRVPVRDDIRRVLEEAPDRLGPLLSEGVEGPLFLATMNAGVVGGGLKVNVIAGSCDVEFDFRVPIGSSCQAILDRFNTIVKRHPGASWELGYSTEPNANPIDDPFFALVARNVEEVRGAPAELDISVGMTDVRLWRERGIPGAIFGPKFYNMGAPDEHILVKDYLDQVRVHTLSALDFLA